MAHGSKLEGRPSDLSPQSHGSDLFDAPPLTDNAARSSSFSTFAKTGESWHMFPV